MLRRVVSFPDGHIEAVTLLLSDREAAWTAHLAQNPQHTGLPFEDIDDATFPADRSKRYAWRVQGGQVVVDDTVPVPVVEQQRQERAEAGVDISQQYQQAMTRLTAIVQDGPTYTAAQTRDALVEVARIQRALLRLVKNAIT